jgi:hypothetical protein
MRILLTLLLFLLAGAVWATDYSQDANCEAYWPMNGATFGKEPDRSGNGLTLTLNTVHDSLMRVRDFAALDTGASRKVTANAIFDLDAEGTGIDFNGTNPFTICGWAWFRSEPGNGVYAVPLSKYNTSVGDPQRQYCITALGDGAGFKFQAAVSAAGTAGYAINSVGHAYTDSTWYHIALTYDGDSLRLYINGVLDSTKVFTAGLHNGTHELRFGNFGATSLSSPFNGFLDDWAMFSRKLSDAEIAEVYSDGITGDNGLSDYPLYTEWYETDGVVPVASEINQFWRDTLRAFAEVCDYCDYEFYGLSEEGDSIVGLSIDPPGSGQEVLTDVAMHGNETATMIGAIVKINYLLANPSYRPDISWRFTNINPDGCGDSTRANSNGVNLNRNFPVGWGVDDPEYFVVSSGTPGNAAYRGPSSMSEAEAEVYTTVILPLSQPVMVFDIHTLAAITYQYTAFGDTVNFLADSAYASDSLFAHGFQGVWDMTMIRGTGFLIATARDSSNGAKTFIFEYDTQGGSIIDVEEEAQRDATFTFAFVYALEVICDPVAQVTGLTVIERVGEIELSWDQVPGNNGYVIYIDDFPTWSTSPNTNFKTFDPGDTTPHEFTVAAYNVCAELGPSATALIAAAKRSMITSAARNPIRNTIRNHIRHRIR